MHSPALPRALTVLYDADCAMCIRCRHWLEQHHALVPLRFVHCRSAEVRELFGVVPWIGDELVVVSDTGDVWAGPAAFVVCMWALESWRATSFLLATPLLAPLTRGFFAFVSNNRGWLGAIVGAGPCHPGHCGVPKSLGAYR